MGLQKTRLSDRARCLLQRPWSGGWRYFQIELGSRCPWYLGPARTSLIFLWVVLSLWITWTVLHAASVFSNRQELEVRLAHILEEDRRLLAGSQQEGIDLSPAALRRLPAEVALANQLLAKRNFSWTEFLSGLEEAIPQRVSIKSVRLDPGNAAIYLTGTAVTVEDVTAFAVKLQRHPVFREPVLGQHHAGGDGLVEFDLSLKYRPQRA